MAQLKSLVKDTAIYGLSSIVGRFLNYLLVPLYTAKIAAESGGYGVVTNLYAFTALILVILTFGMETTYFRFANKEEHDGETVFSTSFSVVAALCLLFLIPVAGFLPQISASLGYEAHPEWVLMMAATVALDALQAIPFCLLRYRRQPLRFAFLKLLFIGLNILLNIIYFFFIGHDVTYVFAINLVCTGFIMLLFIPTLWRMRWHVSRPLLRQMLSYSWPILVLGIAGILNQTLDKMIFPYVYPGTHEQAQVQLGIYGACVKIAMIMAMITQAFRYAYEPLVFARQREEGQDAYYASAMKYFIIFTLLAFLTVMAYIDVLQYIIGPGYREGLSVVPVVMAAEIMMGIYFNLSFWYKLIDRTIYGAWFSLAGCTVLLLVNVAGIPRWGYMACAWGGVAGYGTAMLLSYVVGQAKRPIPYPMRSIAAYVILAAVLFTLMRLQPAAWPAALRTGLNTVLLLFFLCYLLWKDLPLSKLPVVGRHFRH